eukprot:5657827-Prymnesium_polylepis.1
MTRGAVWVRPVAAVAGVVFSPSTLVWYADDWAREITLTVTVGGAALGKASVWVEHELTACDGAYADGAASTAQLLLRVEGDAADGGSGGRLALEASLAVFGATLGLLVGALLFRRWYRRQRKMAAAAALLDEQKRARIYATARGLQELTCP